MSEGPTDGKRFPTCPQCSQPVRVGDRFCRYCGTALPEVPEESVRVRKPPRRPPSLFWIAGALGIALLGLAGFVIHSLTTTRLATAPLTALSPHNRKISPRNKTARAHAAQTTPSSSAVAPSKAPSSPASPVPSTPGGWVSRAEHFKGATLSIALPQTMSALRSSSPGQWIWGFSGGPAADYVSLAVVPAKSSAATEPLGAQAFGTPISRNSGTASQTLDIEWPGHGWVALSMVVPAKDQSWLGTIARSVSIT